MIDILLSLVIVALLAYLGVKDYQDRKERAKMVNLLMAKNSQEAVNLTLADNTRIEPPKQERRDLVSTEELNDQEFQKMIDEQNKIDDVEDLA